VSAPLYAVVLAGGVGSRFWPLSTPDRPKQLLPLITEQAMLVETVDRLVPLVGRERVLILTSERLRDPIIAALPGVTAAQLLLEPRPAGTAAALTWAAAQVVRLGGADARMLCVHADWAIADPARFRETLAKAAELAASRGALATVGIVPSRPDPGFGYIQPGAPLGDGAHQVARFVEKPDRARAATMVAEGYLWNSGIFAWRAQDLLDEVKAVTPELASALAAIDAGAAAFFGAVSSSVSIDVGVLERSKRVLVLPGEFGWDDVGTWSALRRVRQHDDAGNASHGRVVTKDAHGNVVHAEGSAVVLYGVADLVVVVRDGVTLVTTVERASDLKTLVDGLPADLRDLR
jgi:mannose-1-phosphate guanylyltransferase